MSRKPVIYFTFEAILGKAVKLPEDEQYPIIELWASECEDKGLFIGGLQVGQVIDVRVDKNRRTVGLVVEWDYSVEVGHLL